MNKKRIILIACILIVVIVGMVYVKYKPFNKAEKKSNLNSYEDKILCEGLSCKILKCTFDKETGIGIAEIQVESDDAKIDTDGKRLILMEIQLNIMEIRIMYYYRNRQVLVHIMRRRTIKSMLIFRFQYMMRVQRIHL